MAGNPGASGMAHMAMMIAGTEARAVAWLEDQFAIRCYLPQIRTQLITRGKVVNRIEPLFRRYLFILNLVDQWRMVLETPGVLRFLSSGESPEYVRDREIEMIREREDEHGLIEISQPCDDPDRFSRGQRLRVVGGAFGGKSVVHSGLTIGSREFVFFEMFGLKRHRFEFEHEMLVPVATVTEPEKVRQRKRRRRRHGRQSNRNPITVEHAG